MTVSNNSRGFSLPEALIAMLLVLTILGMVAVMMREYSNVARFADAKDQTLDGVQFALSEMANEVGSAVSLVAPAAAVGSTSMHLEFHRMDPSIERYWLDPEADPEYDPDGNPLPVVWDFRNPAESMRVTYRREPSGDLVRELDRGGTISSQIMARSVSALQLRKLEQDYLELEMSFQEQKRFQTFVAHARIWSRL